MNEYLAVNETSLRTHTTWVRSDFAFRSSFGVT